MISPTGLGIRSDDAGDGHFGSLREDHVHKGTDWLAIPGQPLIMPITRGRIGRIAWPYKVNGNYRGVEIQGYERGLGDVVIKLFYMVPFQIVPDQQQGAIIGFAQDISKKYEGVPMNPHIHMEVRQNGRLINPETLLQMEV